MNRRLLYNALIVTDGRAFKGYVEIEGDRIKSVLEGDVPEKLLMQYAREERENLSGKWILPGVIDDQVHFREPGATHKADIESESRAAAAGGVTSYMDMPNTDPQTVTLEAWSDKMNLAKGKSHVNYSFFLGATNSNIDQLMMRDRRRVPGIKVFLGSSTGNMLVDNEKTLDEIFKLDSLIAVHSENEMIIRDNIDVFKARYGDDVPVECHPLIRSREACVSSTEAAVKRAEGHGTKLHVFHLSTAEEVEILRKNGSCGKITGEVCVHHLWFDDRYYKTLGTKVKCNPAIKTLKDRNALRSGLRDGVITVVATDHAPHLLREKEGGALNAASGLPLVQFSLQAMIELSMAGEWEITDVVRWMCHNPAELYGIKGRGYLRPGYFADIVVVNPDMPYEVKTEKIESKCGWSPFEGHVFPVSIESTYVNGKPVWYHGKIDRDVLGMSLEFLA